ncbi:HU family DNA-binding protein [Thermodesulfobacteriota bacterium]
MTKGELVSHIAKESEITKKAAEQALNSFIQAVHIGLKKEGEIRIADLGTFKVIKRKARTGVNPQTQKKMKISASKAPAFRASKALKEAVKKAK